MKFLKILSKETLIFASAKCYNTVGMFVEFRRPRGIIDFRALLELHGSDPLLMLYELTTCKRSFYDIFLHNFKT